MSSLTVYIIIKWYDLLETEPLDRDLNRDE